MTLVTVFYIAAAFLALCLLGLLVDAREKRRQRRRVQQFYRQVGR